MVHRFKICKLYHRNIQRFEGQTQIKTININNIIIREFYAMRVSKGVSSPLLSAKLRYPNNLELQVGGK
ncbi:hypothetical protein CLP36_11905 [Vibrio cholerae]|nr:hypothetical protein [Vibrio cholerae]